MKFILFYTGNSSWSNTDYPIRCAILVCRERGARWKKNKKNGQPPNQRDSTTDSSNQFCMCAKKDLTTTTRWSRRGQHAILLAMACSFVTRLVHACPWYTPRVLPGPDAGDDVNGSPSVQFMRRTRAVRNVFACSSLPRACM